MSTVPTPASAGKDQVVREPQTPDDDSTLNGRRRINYKGRRKMQELLPTTRDFDRLRNCGRHGVLMNGRVKVKVKNHKGKITAGWSGLATCGSVHACPVCAQKIAASRALDILNAMNEWQAQGHANSFVSLTARHNKTQSFTQVADAVTKAFQAVISGKAYVGNQMKFGVEHPGNKPLLYSTKTNRSTGEQVKIFTLNRLYFVRVIETTHSDANGWHVHIHAALFHAKGLKDKDINELAHSFFTRWKAALLRQGFEAPTFRHGIDVKRVMHGDTRWIKDYLTKATYKAPDKSHTASEIAGGTGKKGRWVEVEYGSGDKKWISSRTPFQILEDLTNRFEARDLQLWTEFVIGSMGRRQVTWSTGLRELTGLNEQEATDEEIAASDAEGIVDLTLMNADYKKIWHRSEDVLEKREISREEALDFLANWEIVPVSEWDEATDEYAVALAEWHYSRSQSQKKGNRRVSTLEKSEAKYLSKVHVNRYISREKRLEKKRLAS